MKASDLRIGNIIHDPHKGADGYTYVTARTINALDAHPKSCDFQPIPLTEEWLVKLGFEFFDYEMDVDDSDDGTDLDILCYRKLKNDNIWYELHLITDGFNEFCIHTTYADVVLNGECKYVHQLQNLYFALTGEELTVSEKGSAQEL